MQTGAKSRALLLHGDAKFNSPSPSASRFFQQQGVSAPAKNRSPHTNAGAEPIRRGTQNSSFTRQLDSRMALDPRIGGGRSTERPPHPTSRLWWAASPPLRNPATIHSSNSSNGTPARRD